MRELTKKERLAKVLYERANEAAKTAMLARREPNGRIVAFTAAVEAYALRSMARTELRG